MHILLSLIGSVYAQDAAAGATKQGGIFGMLMPFALIILVFYFFMIRPQQKQKKKHQEFLSTIKKGDEVITSSGLIGTVHAVSDKTVVIELDENVKIKVLKGFVSSYAREAVAENNK
ncbi:MAG: preprotein translocase subunit YajC [Pseudomonadota bacterium]